jgi:hypothetical protein
MNLWLSLACLAFAADPPAHPTLDLMVGLTRAQLRDFPIAFDGTVGWSAPRWGIEAGGSRSYLEIHKPRLIDRTVRWSYGAAAHAQVGPEDGPVSFEVRAELGYEDYKDGFFARESDARSFDNDDFLLAALQGGLRWTLPRLEGALTGGAAYSRDAYHSFAVDADGAYIVDTSDVRRGTRATARLSLRHQTVPDWLDTRLLATFARYRREQILHDDVASPDTWTTTLTREQLLRVRLAGDLVPLASFGVVPGLSLGLDALTALPAPTAVAWVVGVGLASRPGRSAGVQRSGRGRRAGGAGWTGV